MSHSKIFFCHDQAESQNFVTAWWLGSAGSQGETVVQDPTALQLLPSQGCNKRLHKKLRLCSYLHFVSLLYFFAIPRC